LDPDTGHVLGGASKTHKFLHFVEDWHRWLVKKEMDVDGQPVLVGDVLRSRELSGLLSDEGPVVAAGLRYRV
jgi:hypothetical protein